MWSFLKTCSVYISVKIRQAVKLHKRIKVLKFKEDWDVRVFRKKIVCTDNLGQN